MNSLLERFLRYVRIYTRADETSSTYPSSPGQLVLGRMLVEELQQLGLSDARQDEFGIVLATVPATVPDAPTIAWIAHVDTSPETTATNVRPIVHPNYDGRDLVLTGNPALVLRPDEFPELRRAIGRTVITTDGTTLLGADDKSGVAVIMEAVRRLMADRSLPCGPVKVCFTCDEEIGKGVLHLEPEQLGAVVGYTLDGQGEDEIEGETFSADKAQVTITGVNIHPSIAQGKMINAIRLAGQFLERLPKRVLTPETTSGREGFIHAYGIEGGVGRTSLNFLLRDFDTPKLAEQAELLRTIGRLIELEYPGSRVEVTVQKQYRNMADGIRREPRAMEFALRAMRNRGLEPKVLSIRGGTDGAALTEKGLPTPNLATGEHNPHSPLEWTCLEEMETCAGTLVELAKVWSGR